MRNAASTSFVCAGGPGAFFRTGTTSTKWRTTCTIAIAPIVAIHEDSKVIPALSKSVAGRSQKKISNNLGHSDYCLSKEKASFVAGLSFFCEAGAYPFWKNSWLPQERLSVLMV